MENNNEKRMAGCWEILHALHIGDKEVVVGENLTEPNEARYMCAYCTANDIMRGYNECMASDDYLEIMELYTERITGQIEAVKAEIAERQLPDMTISADQCHKNDFSKSIVGKIVAIRADALRREYRSADHQLVLVNGGFGASANARGSAVYATNLYSGKESRYERRDVLGEIKPEHLPHWAMEKAARMRGREKKRHEPER